MCNYELYHYEKNNLSVDSSSLTTLKSMKSSSDGAERRRYSCPPSTAQAPHEHILRSCVEVDSITSPHFLHLMAFLIIMSFSASSVHTIQAHTHNRIRVPRRAGKVCNHCTLFPRLSHALCCTKMPSSSHVTNRKL